MSSDAPSAPQADADAPHGPEDHQGSAERPTDATADARTDADDQGASAEHEARIAELTKRVAELEKEKADREREDAITDLAKRYRNITPEMLHVFGNMPLEELRERAAALDSAIQKQSPNLPIGRGGLDPTASGPHATWPGAFQRARENRRKGESGVTFLSNGRFSGEL
ncbi:hypothetical protein [Streptomyces sp. PT12]|uniref:hypothetical protein n=1 Tax=Streptomyces sp. PT12 TaxID=1510197 RepID=UPI000DE56C83|nr:hypothetical protein [Streptomyces sp. PT12]RBM16063.1 hypothetical protein DEH69_17450 [Streptomyces sp. PT12]